MIAERRSAVFRRDVITRVKLNQRWLVGPLKEPRILRTEQELRLRGARRRNRDLGADCLEQKSGNKQRGGKRGDRKSRRAVAELKRA
eukprot:587954-Pleurochrysis_carterae.AAC.3